MEWAESNKHKYFYKNFFGKNVYVEKFKPLLKNRTYRVWKYEKTILKFYMLLQYSVDVKQCCNIA